MINHIRSLKIEHVAVLVTLAGTFLTVIGFIVGHILAAFYYSYFGIPYFVYTDFSTPFNFFIRSLDFIFNFLILLITLYVPFFIFFVTGMSLHELGPSSFLKEFQEKGFKRGIYAPAKGKIIGFFFALMCSALITNTFSSDRLTSDIQSFNYIPYNIQLDYKDKVYTCVYPLGLIGQHFAFIYRNSQPILVKQDSIILIEQVMSSPPVYSTGKQKNFYYDEQRAKWVKAWKELCTYDVESKFKKFNFEVIRQPLKPKSPD